MSEDDECPWCGEEACERSCTAALAAAVGACPDCGFPRMAGESARCTTCAEEEEL